MNSGECPGIRFPKDLPNQCLIMTHGEAKALNSDVMAGVSD